MARPLELSGVTPDVIGVASLGWIICQGAAIPPDGIDGYAHNCLMLNTDDDSPATLYVNKGDNLSAEFLALPTAGYSPTNHEIDETITIERQRSTMGEGVPPVYLATQSALPGGRLAGDDMHGTVLTFATDITGALIKTEGYGVASTGMYWNDNNTSGDTSQRYNICTSMCNITVNGQAEIAPYPVGTAGAHGQDFEFRAHGLTIESAGFRGENLEFYQIPGTAIVMDHGVTGQSGPYGIYDIGFNTLSHVTVLQAMNGIEVTSGDAKLDHIYIAGIVSDGLTLSAPGATVIVSHSQSADRACVITYPADVHAAYHEGARIGTYIKDSAHGSRIFGLNFGPSTCWYRGVIVQAHSVKIYGLFGTVKHQDATNTDIAGFEIITGLKRCFIDGDIDLESDVSYPAWASTGGIVRGSHHTLHLTGGSNNPSAGKYLKIPESITGCTITIEGTGDIGAVLDFTGSSLNSVNGLGNVFDIKWSGTPTHNIIYPGGGYTYNLAAGNTIIWNGVTLS